MSGWEESTRTGVARPPEGVRAGKRDRPCVIVLAGANVGEMFAVAKEITIIGRGERADVRVLDEGISREHARLVVEGERVFLEDLKSTNGTFCNGQKVDRRELQDGDKILVGATTILRFTYHDDLDESFQRLMFDSALRDGLTRAFNKRYLIDRLQSEFASCLRHRTPLALAFVDIDLFKKVNDTYGHSAGDHVLTEIAQTLMSSLRAEDVCARFGGEEFAIICRGADAAQGQIVAERLRKMVERRKFAFEGKDIPITVSIGVAALPDTAVKTPQELITAADEAMYEAKGAGRNRVVMKTTPK